jgi:hypothetical protein
VLNLPDIASKFMMFLVGAGQHSPEMVVSDRVRSRQSNQKKPGFNHFKSLRILSRASPV